MNEIVKQEVAKNGVARQYSPSFIISITEFLKKSIPWLEVFVNASGIIICPNKGEKRKSSQQSMTDESASTAPKGDVENNHIIGYSKKKSNTFDEKISKSSSDERFSLRDVKVLFREETVNSDQG